MDFMVLFEKIGKWVLETGDKLMMYVKNFSEVNQINRTIFANEKQIAALTTELGQAHYQLNKANTSDPLFEKVSAITALQAEIDANRTRYEQLRTSPKQAAPQAAPAAPAAAAPSGKFCTNCGSTLPAGVTFCTNCGTKLG